MILLCYDGSPDAEAAADRTAELFPGATATALAVWEPYVQIIAQGGMGLAYTPPTFDVEEVDKAIKDEARAAAQAGAERLRHAGLAAEARAEPQGASVAATILQVAAELDARAVVLGTRGRGGLKSLLLGSVSHAVVQHADRPVVIVPSPAVAEARRAHRKL